jgi:hypothetical protein
MSALYRLKRWMYPANRPNAIARFFNRLSAAQYSAGFLAPAHWVTLEVPGRRSGRVVACPLVVAEVDGERYLVAMLGEDTNWVRNVRAAGMRATLRHGEREKVLLVDVAPELRAPILRRYLKMAPGARPHVQVDRRAPLSEFEKVAADYPVFRITPDA